MPGYWKCRNRELAFEDQPLIMGVLNVTPDSFSDGGEHFDPGQAVDYGLRMAEDGADIIDVGGESTRPGAASITAEDEISRVVPVVQSLRERVDTAISIDTMKAEVAAAAVAAGADIINDVSALTHDVEMVNVARDTGAGVVLMHMKGSPQTMQNDPTYGNVVDEVLRYLQERIEYAVAQGVDRKSIVIDPGIGFGKTVEHNLELLRGIPMLGKTAPVLIGASRKSLIGHVLKREDPAERHAGSLGIAGWSAMHGAHILRVHDVIDTCDVCRIVDTLSHGDL